MEALVVTQILVPPGEAPIEFLHLIHPVADVQEGGNRNLHLRTYTMLNILLFIVHSVFPSLDSSFGYSLDSSFGFLGWGRRLFD